MLNEQKSLSLQLWMNILAILLFLDTLGECFVEMGETNRAFQVLSDSAKISLTRIRLNGCISVNVNKVTMQSQAFNEVLVCSSKKNNSKNPPSQSKNRERSLPSLQNRYPPRTAPWRRFLCTDLCDEKVAEFKVLKLWILPSLVSD